MDCIKKNDSITGGIWSNRDFTRLWIGQSISQFGGQITFLALPLAAVQMLHATPLQMGILRAVEYIPFILFGLFAGILTDRTGRKNILLLSDIARALILLCIPLAAYVDALDMRILYVTAFLAGTAGVFFEVAYWSYLPTLVTHEHLVEGNSKLSLSQSMAETMGPGAAGMLVQLLTAPLAIALNAFSFVISALSLMMIRKTESASVREQSSDGIIHDLQRGLRFVFREKTLRALLLRAAVWNFLYSLGMSVFLLYCMHDLKLSATFIGMLFTVMGTGLIAGTFLMGTILHRAHVGTLIGMSMLVAAGTSCGIGLSIDNVLAKQGLLALCLFVIGAANAVYNINNVSLRQAITPPQLLGRMTAAMRVVSWGVMPFGAVLGGFMGERIGFSATLLSMGLAALAAAALGLLSGPIKRTAQLPATPSAEA